jgi:hypothetical protein
MAKRTPIPIKPNPAPAPPDAPETPLPAIGAEEARAAADLELPPAPSAQEPPPPKMLPKCPCGADPMELFAVNYRMTAPNGGMDTWRMCCCKNCRRPVMGQIIQHIPPKVQGFGQMPRGRN